MGVKKEKKRKFNPRPKIDYPPVPTRKWIPPDKRPKKKVPPPQLKYKKPPGLDQKLKPSALRKIWRHYLYHENTAILTGTFCQTNKKFSFRSNGLQSACNCALACVFAHIRDMNTWDTHLMDYILTLGDQLFRKSLEQDPERCWTEISTDRVYNSVYIGNVKVAFEIDVKNRIDEKLTVVNEDKIKDRFREVVERIFSTYFCGLFTMDGCKKTLAFWVKDGAYYLFDPTAHTSCGIFWLDWPGGGVSVCYRCQTLEDFMARLYENVTCHGSIVLESTAFCHSMGATNSKFTSKICKGRFWVEPCMVMRVTEIDTRPPDTFEDVQPVLPPHDYCFRNCECIGKEKKEEVKDDEEPPTEPCDDKEEGRLKQFLKDEKVDNDPKLVEIQELAPEVDATLSLSKRPSWLQSEFEKNDICKYPIPYKKRPEAMSFYLELEPGKISIMRAGTHNRDTNFTKYQGRQSMGNAISSLTMLKFWKSKHWVPAILNRVLKFGDLLYRDAMISIARTQSLKLSNFQKKTEYMGKYFHPIVDDYVVVGRLSSKEFEVLDLFLALEGFLVENECCTIIGPITLSVWVEDGQFYMFDPNERDSKGNAMHNYDEPMRELDCICPSGKACLMRFTNLQDLVDLYMENVEKPYRSNPFYLSRVQIHDWVDIPEAWANFKGVAPGKWVLRGTFNQNDRKFEPQTRNFQSPATSLVAMAMKHLKPIKNWQTEDVNELLELGDRLYKESIETLNEKGLFINKMLMLSDINKEFRFWDQKMVEFTLDQCVSNGIFTAKKENDVMNLYKALCSYFMNYELGVMTCRNISVALWRYDDMYFYCDSHSRDDKGLTTPLGTACIVRTCTIEDIVEMIMCNFAPNPEDYFNITNVVMTFYDLDVEGFIRPVIQFYKKITDDILILRSLYSEINNKYELNANKQTIPMCLLAIGYNKLKPSVEWNQADLDEIMNKGDSLYTISMLDILGREETEFIADTMEHDVNPLGIKKVTEKTGEGASERSSEVTKGSESSKATGMTSKSGEDGGGDAKPDEAKSMEDIVITLDNVKKEFKIGPNKFTVLIEDIETGIIAQNLRTAIEGYFEKGTTEAEGGDASAKEQTSMSGTGSATGTGEKTASEGGESGSAGSKPPVPPFVDHSNKELIILTKPYTVMVWTDSKMYYLFDSKPRDKEGNVFGQSEWSELQIPPPKRPPRKPVETATESHTEGPAPAEGGDKGEAQAGGGEGGGEGKAEGGEKVTDYDNFEEGEGGKNVQFEDEDFQIGEMEAIVGAEEEGEIKYPDNIHKSDSYWAELAKGGRACTIAFLKLEDLVEHVMKNIPPKLTVEETFDLKAVRVTNTFERKDILRPGDLRNDVFEGHWYDFVEIEKGVWILRGTINLYNELFPPYNRGKQQVMAAVCALAIAYNFTVICFNEFSVDQILRYGDRLLSYVKKIRKKQMKEYDPNKLCDEEIDWLLQHEEFGINDVPKKLCISKFLIHVEIEPEIVTGDVKAQEFEEFGLVDVQRGVEKFFEENTFGVLQSKDYAVAIWKGARMYYLFDGLNRGPNGITAACGTACCTRYLKLNKLVETFLANLTRLGKNNFWIHKLTFSKDICPRVRQPKLCVPPVLPCIGGCKEIVPGKTIVRGTLNQDDPKFGLQPSAMVLPIAFIALTMTLLHKTQIWSKPIIDEVIEIGKELYDISVENLGFAFNPWEDKLDVCNVKHDFYIGVLKANCELRTSDQKGVLEAKDPCTVNLRMGIEKFFKEHTHGIIVSDPITVAIWEEEIEGFSPTIYIYDPYPRGPTGMPCFNGVACLIGCNDPRMAANHICSCVLDPDQKGAEYRLVPFEIVVGTLRTRKLLKKVDTGSSIAVLPRCTQDELNKEKRLIRKLAEYERKKKEFRKLQLIGRKAYYLMKNGDALIRGYRSTNSSSYPESVRNQQDIPMCIVALVMHSLYSIENWTYKNVDLVLDTGNQLYIDSYIAYGPKDLKLGPENIIRKFFLRHLTIKVLIYKPIITDVFNASSLNRILNIYFAQESFCMLSHYNQWVGLIAKSGMFYMFDPHERDIEGNVIKKDETGTAVVVRFDNLERMVDKLISVLSEIPEDQLSEHEKEIQDITLPAIDNGEDENIIETNLFTLWLISVEIK